MCHSRSAGFASCAGASGWQRWFFTGIGIAAAVFIIWMLRSHGGQRLFAWALTLILGGAVGNVVDRLIHGYVVDFLQFRFSLLEPIFHGGFFPTFNIADSAITLGAILLILDEILRVRRGRWAWRQSASSRVLTDLPLMRVSLRATAGAMLESRAT